MAVQRGMELGRCEDDSRRSAGVSGEKSLRHLPARAAVPAGGMKFIPSEKYRKRLDNYLEWVDARTPYDNMPAALSALTPPSSAKDAPIAESPEHWLFEYETHGKVLQGSGGNYLLGKQNRDFWMKELRFLTKEAAFCPEELLSMISHLNFIEMFGREPIPELVRFWHDNHYPLLEYRLDMWMKHFQYRKGMWYFERDHRQNACRALWRLLKVRVIYPALWRLRRG